MLPLITFSLRIFGIALPWARIPKDNQRTLFLGDSQEQQGSRTNLRCCLDSFNDCYWIKIMPLILRLSADIVTQKWRTTRGVLHTQFDHSHFLGQKCDNIHLFILRSKESKTYTGTGMQTAIKEISAKRATCVVAFLAFRAVIKYFGNVCKVPPYMRLIAQSRRKLPLFARPYIWVLRSLPTINYSRQSWRSVGSDLYEVYFDIKAKSKAGGARYV